MTRTTPSLTGATRRPIVWTIAGSDSGGGAGIQADLLTIHDLGGHGCSVITAITAQNSVAVTRVDAVGPDALIAQLDALWADLRPAAIKIGLLPDAAHITALANWFAGRREALPPIVLDPVLVASSGARLNHGGLDQFDPLLPYVAVITPNGDELAALTGRVIDTPRDIVAACQRLVERGARAVLAKGGHFERLHPGRCVDLLYRPEQKCLFDGARLVTRNTHGSGCTLSSALATLLAQGYVLEDAVAVVRAYLHNGLSQSCGYGAGPGPLARTGWPVALASFPEVALPGTPLAQAYGLSGEGSLPQGPFASTQGQALGVYPVVDSVEWVERLLELGVKTLQLRIKDPASPSLASAVQRAIALGHRYQARLFINDHWQLAIEHGAYGVHLGQEDLLSADLAAIQRAGLRLGLSTHGYYEILRAHALQPSYIALGHIFPTPTKAMPSAPQGLDRLARYVALVQPRYPAVAIGGIDVCRAHQVARSGVGSIAVVRAITEAPDLPAALAALQAALASCPTLQAEAPHAQ